MPEITSKHILYVVLGFAFVIYPFLYGINVYIVAFYSFIVFTILAYSYYKHTIIPKREEKKRVWNAQCIRYYDAVNIKQLIVMKKDSGLPVYIYDVENMGGKSILVTGFLTGISAFQDEMPFKTQPDGPVVKGFDLSYENFKVILKDAHHARYAMITETDASDTLRGHLEVFIDAFENRYKDALDVFDGNREYFKDVGEIMEAAFDCNLAWSHIIPEGVFNRNLTALQSYSIGIVERMMEYRGVPFVTISDIVDALIISMGDRYSKERIINDIIDLSDRGMLIPIAQEYEHDLTLMWESGKEAREMNAAKRKERERLTAL